MKMIFPIRFLSVLTVLLLGTLTASAQVPNSSLPQFSVPGEESTMKLLNEMHELHHGRAFSRCTLWDAWLPKSTVWASAAKRDAYRRVFDSRRIDSEGYVSMQQHRGMAHSEGWPFPAWQQSTGQGFHFSTAGDGWGIHHFKMKPLQDTAGWKIQGATSKGVDAKDGLQLSATDSEIQITTPLFRCGTVVAPFLRLEWQTIGLQQDSRLKVEWLLNDEQTWPENRSATFDLQKADSAMRYLNLPLYRQPGYAGLLKQYRLTLTAATGATVNLKSLITAIDTRHPITGSLFIRGCADVYQWSGDEEFLQNNLNRMRKAMQFTLNEFSLARQHHVTVPWVGHGGRSGLAFDAQGNKSRQPGLGVGNNYWDLLPFGGQDAMATMYTYDAMVALAGLEEAASGLGMPPAAEGQTATDLRALAEKVRTDFQKRFWNAESKRFVGWIDVNGKAHDYGFTFVNLEAIHYGLASTSQARHIFDWLDGQRTVSTDTSQGEDIYHWRFGPRSTTKRNVRTYVWVWSGPESIPWGNQVQDGGAVLGFSYFDLMARLRTNGPDDAWNRLQAIMRWFQEVQQEGGYRAYYAKPGRGTLQGGGPPGGLGLDREFMESIMVPQVMLYGFLGVQPTATHLQISPQLPSTWPEASVSNVLYRDHVIDIRVTRDTVQVTVHRRGKSPLEIRVDETQSRQLKIVTAEDATSKDTIDD